MLFDKLPLDPAGLSGGANPVSEGTDQIPLAASQVFSPFDDLDQTSIFFEQYLIQDIRTSASVADTLGGYTRTQQFHEQLIESSCSITCRRLVCADDSSAIRVSSTESSIFEQWTKAPYGESILTVAEDTLPPSTFETAMSEIAFDSSLVWLQVELHATSSDRRIEWSRSVIHAILKKLAAYESSTGSRPILIVSALRGLPVQIHEPFNTMGDESVVHVPLWIDDGTGQACRLQQLAGSFDLLPTISHYLTGRSPEEQSPTPSTGQASVALSKLNCKPTSLIHFLRSSEFPPDRLLKLTADAWTGLRTQQYLLIHAESAANPDSPDAENETPDFVPARTRGLYLKPDDLWNVQNSIVAYEAIADEMENVISAVQQ